LKFQFKSYYYFLKKMIYIPFSTFIYKSNIKIDFDGDEMKILKKIAIIFINIYVHPFKKKIMVFPA
jgi:hypothetical protein